MFSWTTAEFEWPEHSASFVSVWLFKVIILPLNRCFRWSRVQITFIKPFLCLNSIFTHFEHSFLKDKCSCKNGEYTAFWYLQLPCYFMQLQFIIGQNEFVEFFGVFRDNCRIWVTWAFSIVCICMTMFKVIIPPLNCCFRWSRFLITFIKPFLCLNSIFSHQKAMFYQHMKLWFFHCFENL